MGGNFFVEIVLNEKCHFSDTPKGILLKNAAYFAFYLAAFWVLDTMRLTAFFTNAFVHDF